MQHAVCFVLSQEIVQSQAFLPADRVYKLCVATHLICQIRSFLALFMQACVEPATDYTQQHVERDCFIVDHRDFPVKCSAGVVMPLTDEQVRRVVVLKLDRSLRCL